MVRTLRATLMAGAATLLLAGSAFAQGAAPLPTMPMPPSASDPTPRESTKAKPKKTPQAKRRADTEDPALATDAPRQSATRAKGGTAADRPGRYVPEEFDRDGGSSDSRARPFMSESGRPGMGMRF